MAISGGAVIPPVVGLVSTEISPSASMFVIGLHGLCALGIILCRKIRVLFMLLTIPDLLLWQQSVFDLHACKQSVSLQESCAASPEGGQYDKRYLQPLLYILHNEQNISFNFFDEFWDVDMQCSKK